MDYVYHAKLVKYKTINHLICLKIVIFAHKTTPKIAKNYLYQPKYNFLYSPHIKVFKIHVCAKFGLLSFIILPSSAQLNPTPTSVGWAEIALISTFTHPPIPPTPRESTELSSAQLNPTPTRLGYRKQNKLEASLS